MTRLIRLHFRSFLVPLVLILPIIGLMAYTHLDARQRAVAEASADALRIARHAAIDQTSAIQNSKQFLETLAAVPGIGQGTATCDAFLDRLLAENPLYQALAVVEPTGRLVCSAPSVLTPVNFSDGGSFRQVMQTRDFVIGNYEIDPVLGLPGLVVGWPVEDAAGEMQAVLFADINLARLSQLAGEAQFPPGAASLVIGRQGTVLARYPDPDKWVGQQPERAEIVQAILAKPQEGMVEAVGEDGVRRLYAWVELPGASQGGASDSGGYVAVGVPSAEVYGPADAILQRNLTLLLAAALVLFFISWEVNEHLIVRQLNRLLQATEQLGRGDLSARIGVPRRLGDWSELGNTFNRMARSLQARERELRATEVKYRSLVEQLPAVTYVWPVSDQGHQAYVSPQVEALLGNPPTDYLASQSAWLRQVHPDDRTRVLSELEHALVEGGRLLCEYRVVTREGRAIWVRDQAVVVLDEQGAPLYVQGVLLDISERKQAEEELGAAERKMRSIFNATFQFIGLLGPDGTVVEMNEAALEFCGLKAAQVVGKPFWQLPMAWNPKVQTLLQSDLRHAAQTGESVRRDVDLQGHALTATVDFSLRPIKNENGQVVLIVFEGHDISTLKSAERALRASEERWRLQIERMPIGCIVRDADFRFQYWNPAAESIFGYASAEVIGKHSSELITPLEIQPRIKHVLQEAANGSGTLHGTNANVTKDGRMIICEWWNTPLRDPNGQITGLLSMVQDITERQRAQEEIAYQAQLLANVSDAIIGTDASCRVSFWNRAAERIDGRTEEQVLGRKVAEILRPPLAASQREEIRRTLQEKGYAHGHAVHHGKVDVPLQLEWNAIALKNAAGQVAGYVTVGRDVTAQKRAEEEIRQLNADLERRVIERTTQLIEREARLVTANQALEQEEEKLRTLIDSIADEVWFCDAQGQVVLMNPAAREGLGLEESKKETLGELLAGLEVLYPDGRPRPVDEAPLFHSLRGETRMGEELVRDRRTGQLRFRHYSSAPMRDSAGRITGAVAVFTDMTERKKAEDEIARLNETLQRRAMELEHANRELDTFAYSVSHDLRTPLASIESFTRLVLQDHGAELSGEGQRLLLMVRENAIELEKLVHDLLAFSRTSRQPLRLQDVAPGEIVRQALDELREAQAGRQIEIAVGELPACQADPVLLKQVYANLLSNAIKFTRTRPVARIEVGNLKWEAGKETKGHGSLLNPQSPIPNSQTVYFVKDNGVGFDPGQADRLFGVFQRLHGEEEYEGAGVGLAIVEHIVRRHGGRVWADAAVDQGATFYFTLGTG